MAMKRSACLFRWRPPALTTRAASLSLSLVSEKPIGQRGGSYPARRRAEDPADDRPKHQARNQRARSGAGSSSNVLALLVDHAPDHQGVLITVLVGEDALV